MHSIFVCSQAFLRYQYCIFGFVFLTTWLGCSDDDAEPGTASSQSVEVHSEVVQRLVSFLDCTSNSDITQAWDLLASSLRFLLMAGEPGRQAVRAVIPPARHDWWFAEHALLVAAAEEREPRCVAKQLTVFDLLLGAGHPLSRRLEAWLSQREAVGGARNIAALFAERRAFALRDDPLFPQQETDDGGGKNRADNVAAVADGGSDFESFLADEWALVEEQCIERKCVDLPWFSTLRSWVTSTAEKPAATEETASPPALPQPRQPTGPRHESYPFLR